MKQFCLFNHDFLFSDNLGKASDKAKLYYIKLCFNANNGFVANPMDVLDSLGYDKSVFDELKANEDILTLPNRDEIFITAFFIHNVGANIKSWIYTPFGIYWKGKLWFKENRMATFKKQNEILDKEVQFD